MVSLNCQHFCELLHASSWKLYKDFLLPCTVLGFFGEKRWFSYFHEVHTILADPPPPMWFEEEISKVFLLLTKHCYCIDVGRHVVYWSRYFSQACGSFRLVVTFGRIQNGSQYKNIPSQAFFGRFSAIKKQVDLAKPRVFPKIPWVFLKIP